MKGELRIWLEKGKSGNIVHEATNDAKSFEVRYLQHLNGKTTSKKKEQVDSEQEKEAFIKELQIYQNEKIFLGALRFQRMYPCLIVQKSF